MNQLEEITLTYLREQVRFGDSNVAIINCKDGLAMSPDNRGVTAKIECDPGDLIQGLSYRFYGTWKNHPKYGKQFNAKTFVLVQPHSKIDILRYLQQAQGIGAVVAGRLWDKFSGQAVRMLREEPEVAAAAVSGLTSDKANKAATFLAEQQKLEGVTIDLIGLLSKRGFPKATGKSAIREWGNRAAELIRKNPYLLRMFPGCGFLRCDQLYLDEGGDPAKLKRQALCAVYAMESDSSGSTWYSPKFVTQGLKKMVSGTEIKPVKAIKLAMRAGLIRTHRDDSNALWLSVARDADNEQVIANRVQYWATTAREAPKETDDPACMTEANTWPRPDWITDISDHQRDNLVNSLAGPLGILTGGPGTGKTYVVARVVKLAQESIYGPDSVAITAPTGKAAVRITEAMAEHGVDLRARTIHSLLGVKTHSQGDGWRFKHDENEPLPYKYIVVDEASMINTDLLAALFRACGVGTHVLLVGDTGQLPPVGHGAPLRDLIASGVPTGELTEVRRNSGRIVEACHEIQRGERLRVSTKLDPGNGENLILLPAGTAKRATEVIVGKLKAIGQRKLADPIWDCQVIVAVNEKSELSRKTLNARLQRELNPSGERAGDNPFHVGDKIVCLKNGSYPPVKDAPEEFNRQDSNDQPDGATSIEVLVANGEQAEVKHVTPNLTIAQLNSPSRLLKIPRASGEGPGCAWDLAFAISCHKSQGSEWPVMLIALDEYPGAKMVCSREWLRTAISRGKIASMLVGKLGTAQEMIGREAIKRRKTFLKELAK